jgi:plastocyanin
MTRRFGGGMPALLLIAALAGCGTSTSGPDGNVYKTGNPAVVVTPKQAAVHRTVAIVKQGSTFAYQPRTITITAGTILTWNNETKVAQNVSFVGHGLPSVAVPAGKSVSATFTRGGTFGYHSTTHPNMHGAVIVNAR